MKVTICSHDGKGYFGGPYEWVKRFGPALRREGIEASFLFFSDHSAKDSSTYLYLKNQGFKCDVLPGHSLTQFQDNTEDRVIWFLKQVQQNPPDIFIANITLFAMFAGKWIKSSGIPVIGVLHSDDPSHEYIYEEFIYGREDFSFSGVVAVSALLRDKVNRHNPYNIPVKAISCGAPVPDRKAKYKKDPFKVIYSGKLTDYQKKITETAHALCEAVKSIPGIEVHIYGAGAESNKVKDIIQEFGKGRPIFFHGLISSDKIQDVFADAQAFVLLSDFEGQPVALMEAMATGLVPICSDIKSGIPELIDHEVTGLLVSDRGENFLAALKKLTEDPDLWNKLSLNAVRKIQDDYSTEATTHKWISFFNELRSHQKIQRPLKIPTEINLPHVNSRIIYKDRRKSNFFVYLYRQLKRLLRIGSL